MQKFWNNKFICVEPLGFLASSLKPYRFLCLPWWSSSLPGCWGTSSESLWCNSRGTWGWPHLAACTACRCPQTPRPLRRTTVSDDAPIKVQQHVNMQKRCCIIVRNDLSIFRLCYLLFRISGDAVEKPTHGRRRRVMSLNKPSRNSIYFRKKKHQRCSVLGRFWPANSLTANMKVSTSSRMSSSLSLSPFSDAWINRSRKANLLSLNLKIGHSLGLLFSY